MQYGIIQYIYAIVSDVESCVRIYQCSTLSKTASCRQQMCLRPSPYRILLFEISQHLGQQDFENLKSFVNDYGVKDDKGALTEATLEKVSSMFNLLLVATQACFIQPHDLSNLTQFLQLSGHHHLVQKIEKFYTESTYVHLYFYI